ncbi:methyltransferase [Amycolatopsis ultiminotia]|uniref:Methyltransferase n=1 Tax=Amycolatopsis ultiminotia TaxID=543629 RepID=A0ABP6YFN7_9PSEU
MSDTVPDGARLRQLAFGFMTTYAVRAAVELRLVEAFDAQARSATEVAGELALSPEATTRLLRALTALGLFTETEPGHFSPTDEGRLLRGDHPHSLNALVDMFTDPVMTRAWSDLATSVRTGRTTFDDAFGKPFFPHLAENPRKSALFNAAMSDGSRAAGRELAAACDFGRFATVIDIGGGDGTVLAEILQRYPAVRGSVYDTAEGGAAAAGRFAAAGLQDRASVSVGDFFTGVPAGGEAYLLKSIVHDWDDETCRTILGHCRTAVPAHGRLLIVEPVLPDLVTPGAPPGLYLSDLNMLVNVGGRERTRADFENLCGAAGFRVAQVQPVPGTGFCLIEAEPA